MSWAYINNINSNTDSHVTILKFLYTLSTIDHLGSVVEVGSAAMGEIQSSYMVYKKSRT
jgi:hypothetical protein